MSLAKTIIIICRFGVKEAELICRNVSEQIPRLRVIRLEDMFLAFIENGNVFQRKWDCLPVI